MSICSICGLYIENGESTVDHVLPKALAKWSSCDDLTSDVMSHNNTVRAHRLCNWRKGCTIPTIDDIDAMYIPSNKRIWLKAKAIEYADYIERFNHELYLLIAKQRFRCARCGVRICINNSVLRRKDNSKPRDWVRNAQVLCYGCSMEMRRPKQFEDKLQWGYY